LDERHSVASVAPKCIAVALIVAGCGVHDNRSPVAPSYTLSGTISGACVGVDGVYVNVKNAGTTIDLNTATDLSGNFVFQGLPAGTYTVTPSIPSHDCTFSPPFVSLTIATSVASVDFTAAEDFCSISGTVSGAVSAGVEVVMTASVAEPFGTTTDASGNYFAQVPCGFDYTVSPLKVGSAFTPASREVANLSGSVTGQDFVATINP
jgi:SdrD B-like domain